MLSLSSVVRDQPKKARVLSESELGLKVLYNPPHEHDVPSVDIMAIHGLGAHPDYTWSHRAETSDADQQHRVNWLSDPNMLPKALPFARIMRFGYVSHWMGELAVSTNVSRIADRLLLELNHMRQSSGTQRRPLLIIASCFGGLVVLKALVTAKHYPEKWSYIYDAVIGIIFLGTPFRGARGLTQAEILGLAESRYKDNVKDEILRIFDPKDEMLMGIVHEFEQLRATVQNRIAVTCFYETMESNMSARLGGTGRTVFVVDEGSGCLDSATRIPLNRDHFNMNKFWDPDSSEYRVVEHVIKGMVDNVSSLHRACPHKDSSHNVNFRLQGVQQLDQLFGREIELQQIGAILQGRKTRSRQAIVVVYGLGGIGKTQLVAEYARVHRDQYTAVFWMDGASEARLRQSFVSVAQRIPEGQLEKKAVVALEQFVDETEKAEKYLSVIVCGVLEWLSLSTNPDWLLIFDNIDHQWTGSRNNDQSYDIKRKLPLAEHGSVIITSRLSTLHKQLGADSLKLHRVTKENAKEILEHSADDKIDDVDLILEKLDGLPLALTQAGSFIRLTGMSAASYVKHYDTKWQELMHHQGEPRFELQSDDDSSILTTWNISYEAVLRLNPDAALLLRFWGFLEPKDLWHGLLAPFSLKDFFRDVITPDAAIPDVVRMLSRFAQSELDYLSALSLLSRFSLIDRDADHHGHSMHPVLHSWCYQLTEAKERDEWFWPIAFIIGQQAFKDYHHVRRLHNATRLLPHAKAVARLMKQDWDLRSEGVTQGLLSGETYKDYDVHGMLDALDELTFFFHVYGSDSDLLAVCKCTQNLSNKMLGPEDISTSRRLMFQANWYRTRKNLEEALTMYQLTLNSAGKDDHFRWFHAEVLCNMGETYARKQDYNEAVVALLRARKLLEQGFNDQDDPEQAKRMYFVVLVTLGQVFEKRKQVIEARETFDKALAWCRSVDVSPKVHYIHILACWYESEKNFSQAKSLYEQEMTVYMSWPGFGGYLLAGLRNSVGRMQTEIEKQNCLS